MSTASNPNEVSLDALSIAENFSTDPGRPGKKDNTIMYKSSKNEIYTVTIPSEGITKEKVAKAIQEDYAKRKNLLPTGLKG